MKRNNKGIAMITVVIAVTFIGVLAASLVYLSYMNYITKNMRHNSNDAFYTAEYVLSDLTSILQEQVFEYAKDHPEAGISEAVAYMYTQVGGGSYSGAALVNLINTRGTSIADSKSYSVVIESVPPTGDYVNCQCDNGHGCGQYFVNDYSDGKYTYFTLHNVKITVTDKKNKYTSTIITHITLVFDVDGPADMDINDFSIITDKPVILNGGNFVWAGNILIKADNPASENALSITGNTVMTLNGKHGILYGNVYVGSGCSLSINGNVRIIGNVVNDGTIAINDKDCACSGSYSGGGRLIVNGKETTSMPSKNYDGSVIANGCEWAIFSENIELITFTQNNQMGHKNSKVVIKMSKDNDTYTPSNLSKTSLGSVYSFGPVSGSQQDIQNGIASKGKTARMESAENPPDNAKTDALVLLMSVANQYTRGSYSNCTILCPFKPANIQGDDTMGAGGKGKPSYSKMDTITYNDALTACVGATTIQCSNFGAWKPSITCYTYDPTDSTYKATDTFGFDNLQLKFNGNATQYATYLAAAKNCEANGTDFNSVYPDVFVYSFDEPSDKEKDVWGYDISGTEKRYIFCNSSGEMFFPYNHFLNGKSSTNLSKIFNDVDNSGDPSNTTSYYSYWLKE